MNQETKRVVAGAGRLGRAGLVARGRRRGFNFTEVMFAVMILGLGFIMVAAMFPVTIRQTATNMEEAAAANLVKGAVQAIQSVANEDTFPTTGTGDKAAVMPLSPAKFAQHYSRGNAISAQNPRYGWVALYKRPTLDTGDAPYAQVFVIALQNRNRAAYSFDPLGVNDLARPAGQPYATLEPREVKVAVKWNLTASEIEFKSPSGVEIIVAPGTYVVIGNDGLSGANAGLLNGRIYLVGNPIDESTGKYELVPGSDQDLGGGKQDPDLNNATAYIVGRGYTNPGANDYTYSGPAQDIGVYTTFIRVDAPPAN
ncbi:MAG TPA: type II secretion system protein [Tepidisphaeraceae bacterium]|nr:type II secretion system protein [Tepidisphaeraceae bacterium]